MAATLVGGAFLSASVQNLIDKLTSSEFRDYIKNRKLNVTLLKELETTLLTLQAVLDDAEEKKIINPAVKQWLDELKDAIFDAEDLLSQISYDSLRCKVENTEAENITNQVWNFLSSPFNTLYREINSQMKNMCERLQLFAQHKDILGLQTAWVVLEKTTLAQLLYNDEEVEKHFDLKAWACVSEDFDIFRLTKTLLESVTSRACERNDLDFLRVELRKNLSDKRFLFVLDDLWNDKYNDWDELVTPLINGKTGSRVIITTRQQKVAEVTHTFPIHKLEPLSDEDCWSLLSKHAFGSEDFHGNEYQSLEAIGKKIAKRCGGLPIAAKTLGGLLRSKVDAKEWTAILNSNIWELPNDDILPALLLSYQYLPSHLKRCFAYCSIFPKDYPLDRKQLVLLWMAEGFLEHSQCKKAMEEHLTELPAHVEKLVNLRHLDISLTSIREMPMQIVELENLQTLTVFVVGKQQGLSIKELRKFPHLQGKLSILNLHNVIDVMEAYDVNLKSKEQIEELKLCWGKLTEDSQKEKGVLDRLQPTINLKRLSIGSYGGTSFPSWLGDSSFSNLVSVHIGGCEYCVTLPPLGRLPALKDLRISSMTLETIGPEFYGLSMEGSLSSFQPFPSLEFLGFWCMSNWKEWVPFENGKFPFPRLKKLEMQRCPELRGHLPSHLFSIEEILIYHCDHLLATPPTLHWLLTVKKINIGQDFPSQGSTEKFQCSLLECDSPCLLQHIDMRFRDKLLSLPKMILSSTCLRYLRLDYVPSLTAFPANGLPTSLQSLEIYGCENLTFLSPETWTNYTSLETLNIIDSCNSLTSFQLDGFPVLQRLFICRCSCLESIFISESSSLLPLSLQSLIVHECKALRSLPQRIDTLAALDYLSLTKLAKLEWSFSEGAFLPPKLRSFEINSLRLPPPTPMTEWGLQSLTALSDLSIGSDEIVNSLLKGNLLPICLVSLCITDLSEMKSLDGNGLQHLSSLERLKFDDCPRLESLPDDKLPSSLKILEIEECPLLEGKYKSQSGERWTNIAHIPVIIINQEVTI
ncbi:P-loop containing nucleoside triphosphate hydrolase [Sesbania bispinosa]|nr:P-loop containing nucleoside triphosphate hydrolase [Sesbania bispinosa]